MCAPPLPAGLYRKLVSYVLLRSGLGSPTEISVVREATGTTACVFLHFLGLKLPLSMSSPYVLRPLLILVTIIEHMYYQCIGTVDIHVL